MATQEERTRRWLTGQIAHTVIQAWYLATSCYRRPVSCDNRVWYLGRSRALAEGDDVGVLELIEHVREPVRSQWEATLITLRLASVAAAALPEYQGRPGQNRFDIFDVETLDCYEIKPDNPAGLRAGRRELDHRIEVYKQSTLASDRGWAGKQRRQASPVPGVKFPVGVPGVIAEMSIPVPFLGTMRVRRYPDQPGIVAYKLNLRRKRSLDELREAYAAARRMQREALRAKVDLEIAASIAVVVVGTVVAAQAGAAAYAALVGEAAVVESAATTAQILGRVISSAEAAEAAEIAQVAAMLARAMQAAEAAAKAAQGVAPLLIAPPLILGPAAPAAPTTPGLAAPGTTTTNPPISLAPVRSALDDAILTAKKALDLGAAAVRWCSTLDDRVDTAVQDVFQRWDDALTESVVWDADLPAFRSSEIPPMRFDTAAWPSQSSSLPGGTPGSESPDEPAAEPETPESGGVAADRAERQRERDRRLDRSAAAGIATEVTLGLEWAGNDANPVFDPIQSMVAELLSVLAEVTPGGLPAVLTTLGLPAELSPRDRLQWPAIAAALLRAPSLDLLTLIGVTEFLVTADDAVIADMVGGADPEQAE